jgi:hyperosmotically inducible periplasmic protein
MSKNNPITHLLLAGVLAGAFAAAPAFAEHHEEADNTGKNVRDRGDDTLTPTDQGGSAADRELTAKIRQAIVDDDALSVQAQNVKIITIDGAVTLRGPVESAAEKSAIDAKAKKIAGAGRVHNQLEIDSD